MILQVKKQQKARVNMSKIHAVYDYVKGVYKMKVQEFMIPIYGYLVSTGAYALTKADRKEGQKVIPKAYIEVVATWIAKKMEERHREDD